MPQGDDSYSVTRMGAGEVVLRLRRPCTARELCAALGLGRQMTARVLGGGQLTVAGKPVAHHTSLPANAEAQLTLRVTRAPVAAAQPPAPILWHDRLVLAAEKPAGLLVHSDGTGADTLTAHVQASVHSMAAAGAWDAVPAPQALQRLDKETTGIVLFSLAEEFQPAFDALVAGHDLHKRYLAIVRGAWPQGLTRIEAPLGRDRHDARRMRVSATGKPALTKVRCLGQNEGCSLLAVELGSGRRHQIRVHLAHAGHPIVGDALYGGGRGPLMLHAYEESFVHPVTGEDVCVRTAWPNRFLKLFPARGCRWEQPS